jgi:hypothetical protein
MLGLRVLILLDGTSHLVAPRIGAPQGFAHAREIFLDLFGDVTGLPYLEPPHDDETNGVEDVGADEAENDALRERAHAAFSFARKRCRVSRFIFRRQAERRHTRGGLPRRFLASGRSQ